MFHAEGLMCSVDEKKIMLHDEGLTCSVDKKKLCCLLKGAVDQTHSSGGPYHDCMPVLLNQFNGQSS